MKKLAILLLATGLAIALVQYVDAPKSAEANAAENPPPSATASETIPDRIAYSLLLRLVSELSDNQNERQARAYVNRIGFENESDVQALFAVAKEFRERVSHLDAQVKASKEGNIAGSNRKELGELRSHYETAVDECIKSLFERVSEKDAAKLRDFMETTFKPKVKLRSDSGSPL